LSVFEIAAFVLSGCSLLMLAVLVTRRWELARRARRRHRTEDRLKQVALALMDSESRPNTPAAVAVPADLTAAEKEALADVLGRYARTVRGSSHERIVEYFAAEGTIERERSALAGSGPAWRRATAAFRLGDIGNGDCVPALIAALRDREPEVRTAAARSLGRLQAAEAGAELVAAAAERRVPDALVRWALLQIGVAAVPELKALLSSSDQYERAAAIQLIGRLGGPHEAAAVQERLRDSSALVRSAAARALGRLGAERHIAPLLEALEDRIPAVRESAATALGYLRDRRALPALIERAENDLFDVAREAARAVVRIDRGAAAVRARDSGSDHLREAVDLAGIR
jgi:HEAT repeat protein